MHGPSLPQFSHPSGVALHCQLLHDVLGHLKYNLQNWQSSTSGHQRTIQHKERIDSESRNHTDSYDRQVSFCTGTFDGDYAHDKYSTPRAHSCS